MAAKALLDENPDPTVEEIKQALRRNLCRCTGYKKIIEAVQLAGRFLRGEITPGGGPAQTGSGRHGRIPSRGLRPWPRPAAPPISPPTIRLKGALELAVLRSTLPHARIVSIDASRRREDARGRRGADRRGHQGHQHPEDIWWRTGRCSAGTRSAISATRFWRWRPTPGQQAEAALAAVKVEFEPLPVLSSPEDALAAEAVQIHDEFPNLCFDQPQIKGDAEEALRKSAAVIEARFKTQINHQAPLEPEATIAYWEKDEGEETTSW